MEVLIVGEKAHKDCVGKEGFGRDSALCLRGCQLLRQKSDGEGSMSAFFEVSHRLLWEALWGAPSASRMAWLTQQLLPAWALCVVHCCRCSPQVWLLLHNQKNWRKGRTQTKRAALEMPSRASENVSFCSGRRNDGLVSAGECLWIWAGPGTGSCLLSLMKKSCPLFLLRSAEVHQKGAAVPVYSQAPVCHLLGLGTQQQDDVGRSLTMLPGLCWGMGLPVDLPWRLEEILNKYCGQKGKCWSCDLKEILLPGGQACHAGLSQWDADSWRCFLTELFMFIFQCCGNSQELWAKCLLTQGLYKDRLWGGILLRKAFSLWQTDIWADLFYLNQASKIYSLWLFFWLRFCLSLLVLHLATFLPPLCTVTLPVQLHHFHFQACSLFQSCLSHLG